MLWVYVAAAAGIVVLFRLVVAIRGAAERVVARTEERLENHELRSRLERFTS
jgi:hypothetical protein